MTYDQSKKRADSERSQPHCSEGEIQPRSPLHKPVDETARPANKSPHVERGVTPEERTAATEGPLDDTEDSAHADPIDVTPESSVFGAGPPLPRRQVPGANNE